MKNIVGQVPRGDDFFPREKIVNLIYRRLNSGANVYMAAPRRVGKTAIMRHLEDNPRKNCEFKYIITESVDSPIIFFKHLSNALHDLKSLSKKSIDTIKGFMPEFERMSVITTGVELKFAERHHVFENFKKLIKDLDTQGKTLFKKGSIFNLTLRAKPCVSSWHRSAFAPLRLCVRLVLDRTLL